MLEEVTDQPQLRHLILMSSAVNAVDASALESLEAMKQHLSDSGVTLHLSEVKGPVMDALERAHFLHDLTGQVFMSHVAAFNAVYIIANIDDAAQDPPDLWAARGMI